MIRYSCDRCKRTLDPDQDMRYVVKIEAQAALEAPPDADDDEGDRDHLAEISDQLDREFDAEDSPNGDELSRQARYDLCASCYTRFIQNPLGSESPAQIGYSSN